MAKELPEKSTLRPWLDATEAVKFVKGIAGMTSDYWHEQPKLDPCWRGGERVWHPEGRSYQSQCLCSVYKVFVNPGGFTCELCKARQWPEAERFRAHVLPALDAKAQEKAILAAVNIGRLTEGEAIDLGAEFGLG